MSKISESGKNVLYHKIYNLVYDNPRIPLFRISQRLGISRNSASRYLKEMYEKGILFGPEMRLKSFPALEEYCYFLKAEEPLSLYEKLKTHPDLIYECMSIGDWDLLVMTSKPIDFSPKEGIEIIVGGKRGDFFYPRPKLTSWERAHATVQRMIDEFSEEKSTLECKHENPTWDDKEWKLFYEFKYDLRKKTLPILKKHDVSWETYENWYKSLPQYATIFANFYPEGYKNYMDLTFLVESGYEKDVLEIFGGFPTSSIFTKVGNILRVSLNLRKDMLIIKRMLDSINNMRERGIIKKYMKAIDIVHSKKT